MIIDRNIAAGGAASGTASSAVLSAIRRIIRASDIQSKRLQRATGLTTAQALIMREAAARGETTTRALADAAQLSQATVTTILDRLELNGLVERYRSKTDKRVVHTRLTGKGRALIKSMPDLVDENFMMRFTALSPNKRKSISSALADVARMMDADASDTAAAVNGCKSGKRI